MGMVRRWLHDDSYEVQCPTCRQCVPASKAVFDGVEPLPRHSRWSRSVVQDSFAHWPIWVQRRWIIRLALRLEILVRHCNVAGEPVCEDVTPRYYREWLPEGAPEGGPS
jgi:hypothetical protein